MASRYALYIRDKWHKNHNPCFQFSVSFPNLETAMEKLEWCQKNTPNVEAILLESVDVGHEIDPYHKHFVKDETNAA